MFRHRFVVALASATAATVVAMNPAAALSSPVQTKTVTGPHNRVGKAQRFQEISGGKVSNWVNFTADDVDGSGGMCTEVWVDYSTKPHEHWNPGVFVNCSGGKRTVKGLTNSGKTITGMGVVVCEVPKTSGKITRNSSNCRGNLGAMYLHSGQAYSRFDVDADQSPSGIQVYF